MRILSLLSEYLEEQQHQGHLCGGQDYLASHNLPQYFLDGFPLPPTICNVPLEVDEGVKGTYIDVIA